MNTNEKITITHEKIQNEIIKENKGSFSSLFVSLVVFLIFIYLSSLLPEGLLILKIALYIIFTTLSVCCLFIFVRYSIIFKTGEFGVIEDTVIEAHHDKIDKKALLNGSAINPILKEQITFKRMGTMLIEKHDVGHYSVGDKFYLVIIKPFRKNKIIKLYNSREYNYKK